MNSLIKIEQAHFSYEGQVALDNISLEIHEYEKVVMLGNNGSGKSTLLRVIAGLFPLKKGQYFFKGQRIKKGNKDFRKRVGILFQNPDSMIFNPTVYDEIAFSLREFGFENIDDRVHEMAKLFEMEKHLKKSPINLSGGEKQKLMLAAILAYDPELLILDEPTAAMDPRTTGWFIDFLIDLKKTTIVSTHDLSLAYETCERSIVINENHKKIYDGKMEALLENLELLLEANLIHKHKHKHKNLLHSHYHLHF